LVCLEDLRKVPAERRSAARIRDIMSPARQLVTTTPEGSADDALALLSKRAVNQLPVLDHDALVGMVRREDILRWLVLRGGEDTARLA